MLEVCILNLKRPLKALYKEAFLSQVSLERRAKINRFRREIDGQRTLCGEILIKSMLAKYLKKPINRINFQKNEFGKPYLEGNPLYFNISHSGEWVVGIISDHLVGIDVEEIKKPDLGIAERFFTKAEYIGLSSIKDEALRQKMFYMFWSCKESYIKMVGKGLTIPLDAFELMYEDEGFLLKIPYEGIMGYFKTYPLENYSLVICSNVPSEMICYEVSDEMLYEVVTQGVFDNFMKRD